MGAWLSGFPASSCSLPRSSSSRAFRRSPSSTPTGSGTEELGYEQVFLKSLSAQATTGQAVGGVVFVILWLNLRLSLRLLRRREFTISTPDGPRVITVDTGRLRSLIYAAALVAAVLIGLYSASSWATWLYAIHATPFGRTDPVLGRDIALLPVPAADARARARDRAHDRHPHDRRRRRLARRRRQPRARSAARRDRQRRRQAASVAARRRAPRGPGLRRVAPDSASAHRAVRRGLRRLVRGRPRAHARVSPAGRRRAHRRGPRRLPGLRRAAPAHRLGHRALHRRRRRRQRLCGHHPALRRRSQRAGARDALHRAQHHARRARRSGSIAWKSASSRATRGSRGRTSSATPRRSRTCRSGTISRCSTRSDRSRRSGPTTTSPSVDNDRYIINGKYRQIMLSARELNSRSLPSRTWINEQLTFTHGYGLTLGPVNEVTPEGLPVLFIRDLPLASTVDLKVTPAGDLLRRAARDRRLRPHQDRRVRLSARRRQRLCDLPGQRRRAARRPLPPADVRDPVPLDRHVLLADADAGEPRDDAPADQRAGEQDRALPDLRSRSLHGDHRGPPGVDSGRLHDEQSLSVRERRRAG